MNWKTYADEYGPKKKARGNQIELYETLYDTITAWVKIAAGTNVREQIVRPEFVASIIGSDREDNMTRLEL